MARASVKRQHYNYNYNNNNNNINNNYQYDPYNENYNNGDSISYSNDNLNGHESYNSIQGNFYGSNNNNIRNNNQHQSMNASMTTGSLFQSGQNLPKIDASMKTVSEQSDGNRVKTPKLSRIFSRGISPTHAAMIVNRTFNYTNNNTDNNNNNNSNNNSFTPNHNHNSNNTSINHGNINHHNKMNNNKYNSENINSSNKKNSNENSNENNNNNNNNNQEKTSNKTTNRKLRSMRLRRRMLEREKNSKRENEKFENKRNERKSISKKTSIIDSGFEYFDDRIEDSQDNQDVLDPNANYVSYKPELFQNSSNRIDNNNNNNKDLEMREQLVTMSAVNDIHNSENARSAKLQKLTNTNRNKKFTRSKNNDNNNNNKIERNRAFSTNSKSLFMSHYSMSATTSNWDSDGMNSGNNNFVLKNRTKSMKVNKKSNQHRRQRSKTTDDVEKNKSNSKFYTEQRVSFKIQHNDDEWITGTVVAVTFMHSKELLEIHGPQGVYYIFANDTSRVQPLTSNVCCGAPCPFATVLLVLFVVFLVSPKSFCLVSLLV